MTRLIKTMLTFLCLVVLQSSLVTSLSFMTSTTMRVNLKPIAAFRRTETTTTSRPNDGADVSIKSGPSDYQDYNQATKMLEVDTSGFGNADAGVETFRHEMIDLVYSRSLDRMNDLLMN